MIIFRRVRTFLYCKSLFLILLRSMVVLEMYSEFKIVYNKAHCHCTYPFFRFCKVPHKLNSDLHFLYFSNP